jgi:GNAT superfamily N-acetyltransferase
MRIRTFLAIDIPFGLRLSAQNGWNQLEGDWRRQLDLEPRGGFVAELDGTPVGTACSCVFGDVAWVNLVLVEQHARGKGIGSALMRQVLDHLDRLGVASVRLDATALGQPVYEKLGFVGDFSLARYAGIPSSPVGAVDAEHVVPMTGDDLQGVCQMDTAITQVRRDKLLGHLFETNPESARKYSCDGELQGYCLARPGAHAWQIGPTQGSAAAGQALLLDAARRFADTPIHVDAPIAHADAIAAVEALGLTQQRRFLRMTRGRRVGEDLDRVWSTFGPEKG